MNYSLPLLPLGPEFAEAGFDGWHLVSTGLLPVETAERDDVW